MRRVVIPLLGAATAAVVLGVLLGQGDPSRPTPRASERGWTPHLVPRPDESTPPATESTPPATFGSDSLGSGGMQLLPPATAPARVYPL
jgi:hypothetical protein